ncbi:MAG: hypothetical protein LBQ92_00200, partial [Propionibacteriaceae bacterium]|nr:hypothetical protein [Propionibacteriaceae bacterium]
MEARRVAENERKPRKWPAALSLLVLALLLVGGLVGLPLLQAEPEPEPVPTPTPKPTINTVTPIHSYTP